MRWKFKPVPAIKTLAATLSMWTMCIAPVAQGAEAARNKQLINQYLKESGLTTQKMTIGQFWGKVRHIYPTVLQKQLDPWMSIHKNEPMPSIQASSFKDSDNNEQVRIVLTAGSETGTLTFTGDDDKPLKVNGVTLTRAELADYNKFEHIAEKIGNQDPVLKKSLKDGAKNSSAKTTVTEKRILKGKEIANLPLRQQMEYFLKMRTATEAADRVMDLNNNKGRKGASLDYGTADSAVASLWQVLLGAKAVAKVEQACIASGWVASYAYDQEKKRVTCGAPIEGRATILKQVEDLPFNASVKSQVSSCAQGGGLPCNPLLFGFENNSGKPICITSSLNTATAQCDSKAKLPDDKERIIQSIVAARGSDGSLCKIKGEKTVSQACSDKLEKYTDNLTAHYLNAAQFCTNGGVKSVTDQAAWVTKSGILKDQKEACDKLKDRFFDLQVEVAGPVVPAQPCGVRIPGSHDENGTCLCSDGKPPRPPAPQPTSHRGGKVGKSLPPPPSAGQSGEVAAPKDSDGQLTCEPVVDNGGNGDVTNSDLPGGKDVKKDTCGFLCKYKGVLIAVGVGLVGLGLFWWLTKKKTKASTPQYVAPAPPPLTDPTVSPTTSPIDTVPTNPCPAPNTVINGVCTAPIYVPPTPPVVTTPTTEGGTKDGGAIGGATR